MKKLFFAFLACGLVALQAAALSLDGLAWHPVAPGKLGINTNYLLDGAIPETRLRQELTQTGARWLRYPGGEKSDNHLWSIPPYTRPAPRTALTGSQAWPAGDSRFFTQRDGQSWAVDPLDFDEFMHLCRQLGAEPVVVVAQQAAHRPKDESHGAISEDTLIETAVAWVRYCRAKGHSVRYWEIGNEAYLHGSQTPADFAASWTRFARAMKAADPALLIGVNAPDSAVVPDPAHPSSGPWWPAFLHAAGLPPDWISLHDYPCYRWKSYAAYTTRPVRVLPHLDGILDALAVRHGRPRADSVPLLVTETNSADWYGHPQNLGWQHGSSLGHGLVLFDMLGQYLQHPGVAAVLPWNSRWLKNRGQPELWDAFSFEGSLLPTGRALAFWHDHYPAELAVVPAPDSLRIYAGRGARAGAGTLYLINKSLQPTRVELPSLPDRIHVWSGRSPDDPAPVYQTVLPARSLDLPAHSLTLVETISGPAF